MWVARVLLFFKKYAGRNNIGEEVTFILYIDCSHPIDEIDQTLGRVCLRLSTCNEMDHTLDPGTFS